MASSAPLSGLLLGSSQPASFNHFDRCQGIPVDDQQLINGCGLSLILKMASLLPGRNPLLRNPDLSSSLLVRFSGVKLRLQFVFSQLALFLIPLFSKLLPASQVRLFISGLCNFLDRLTASLFTGVLTIPISQALNRLILLFCRLQANCTISNLSSWFCFGRRSTVLSVPLSQETSQHSNSIPQARRFRPAPNSTFRAFASRLYNFLAHDWLMSAVGQVPHSLDAVHQLRTTSYVCVACGIWLPFSLTLG
jgi:hypothetical protein